MAAGDLAWAWACLKQSGNYRAAWQAHAARSRYENDTPFPVRIRSGADRIAERDWSLFAWEDPDGDALSAFFADAPMLDGEGSASAPPLLLLPTDAGSRIEGVRMDDGALVVKVEAADMTLAVQVRIARPEPLLAGGGVRLVPDWGLALPVVIARLGDLWSVTGGPDPRRGVGGRAHGNGNGRSCWPCSKPTGTG